MTVVSLQLNRVESSTALKDRIYAELKRAITSFDIYSGSASEYRLDERQLSEKLGVSRTPIREALVRLENEGFVKNIPRRGAFVARKSKKEILEMLVVWAALESMAARLVTEHASDLEIASLRSLFATYDDDEVSARINEYSETNIHFHQKLFAISHCDLLGTLTENLFIHMRSIRMRTIHENDRAMQSIQDHLQIIEALETRSTDLAERLVRQHTLDLAKHVEDNVNWLD
jgi:DNA-binding GntR family transcriptional regulator